MILRGKTTLTPITIKFSDFFKGLFRGRNRSHTSIIKNEPGIITLTPVFFNQLHRSRENSTVI